MATSYFSNRTKAGVFSVGVGDTGPTSVPFTFTIPAAGFALNDTVKLGLIPANSVLCGFYISSPQIDTGAGALRIGIGDSSSATTFVNASTTGSAAAFDLLFNGINGYVAGSVPKAYTAEDWLILKITTAPSASAVAGTISGWIMYNMNPGNLS